MKNPPIQLNNFRHIAKNTAYLFADRLLRISLGLIVNVALARHVGPENFGLFNYAIGIVTIFSALGTLGLDTIVVRDLVSDKSSKDSLLGSVLLARTIGSLALVSAALGAIYLMRGQTDIAFWIVGITAAGYIFQSFDIIDLWFQSNYKFNTALYAKTTSFLLFSVIKLVIIKSTSSILLYTLAGFFELATVMTGLIIIYRLAGHNIANWRFSIAQISNLLTRSWPIIAAGLATLAQARLDQLFLGQLTNNIELGYYSAGLRIIEAFSFIPVVIQSSIAPYLTVAKNNSENEYHHILLNIYRLMFILFIMTSLPLWLFPEQIIIILFGASYQPAGPLLALATIRSLFANFGVAKHLFIVNNNLTIYALITAAIGTIVNIALNIILIPKLRAIGAISSMAISFFITTFLCDLFYARTRINFHLMIKACLTPLSLFRLIDKRFARF